ncbi:Maf-like protein [Gossypium australe]|uniref:Maf-like protein n=1 Tax=Gossypium australe TaxID=47621 RepID=A0A5B6V2L3_9ROSI|nr:Maf-like protein [Gossypium australe]
MKRKKVADERAYGLKEDRNEKAEKKRERFSDQIIEVLTLNLKIGKKIYEFCLKMLLFRLLTRLILVSSSVGSVIASRNNSQEVACTSEDPLYPC